MMRKIVAVLICFSVVLFPWPLTASLVLGIALFEPFVPLIVGLLFDIFYYVPHEGIVPLATVYGAFATVLALFVRSRLKTSIIGE